MNEKSLFLIVSVFIILASSGCNWLQKKSGRETIFDRVVSIPDKLILDIPKLPPLCDEIPGLKKGYVDVKNGKLYYEQEGKGIPLVLISGGPGGTHHGFHPYFSQIKDLAHIFYYDQRGTGNSSKDDTGKTYTIKQAVEDLESLRKILGIDKWFVLGWSYGGFLAQCYALTYSEHIKGLILVAAEHGLTKVKIRPEREYLFISEKEKNAIDKCFKDYESEKLTETQALYNALLFGDWKRQSYYKPTKEEIIRLALYDWKPAKDFNKLMSIDMNKISLDGKFDDFKISTLIFEGRWDLTWDTDKIDLIRKNHPNAQFELFEKSGHKIFADEPERFLKVLRNFLEKIK